MTCAMQQAARLRLWPRVGRSGVRRGGKSFVVRATDDKKEDKPDRKVLEETVRELRKANVDKETATEILKLWQSNGIADDPEELRRLYREKSIAVVGRFGAQLLLDAGACYASYMASQAIGNGDDFFGRGVITFMFGAIAFNYGIAFISNAFSMFVSLSAMQRFGVNASSFLEAMKIIAGNDALDAIAKARAAVDGYKIAQALEKMDLFLKEKAVAATKDGNSTLGTLDSLAVYLTLQKARELYGFKQEDFGLTDNEAIDIARVFSLYDSNDDYRLDVSEFERLCQDSGRSLSLPEVKAALKAIDENGNGYIEFTEFVRFWKNPQAVSASAAQDVVSAGTAPDAAKP